MRLKIRLQYEFLQQRPRFNYGKEFHFEDNGVDSYGKPVTYVKDEEGVVYARVVEICVKNEKKLLT